jgi:hypothetical protein
MAPRKAATLAALLVGLCLALSGSQTRAEIREPIRTIVELRNRIDALSVETASAEFTASPADRAAAFADSAVGLQVVSGKGEALAVDIKFALAQLAVQFGKDSYQRLDAIVPKTARKAIFVRGGTFTIAQLATHLAGSHPGALVRNGTVYRLNWPVIVWSDATLSMEPGTVLELSGAEGAFIFNSGLLLVDRSEIRGIKSGPDSQTHFTPFLVTVLAGALQVKDSTLSGLGYRDGKFVGGVSLIGNILYPARARSFVINSRFDNVDAFNVRFSVDLLIAGNRFDFRDGQGIQLHGVRNAIIRNNLLRLTAGGSGISIRGGSKNVLLADNAVVQNSDVGIQVADGSRLVEIHGNLLAGSRQANLSIARALCVTVTDNTLFEANGPGIKVRASRAVTIARNLLVANHGPGVSFIGPFDQPRIAVAENRFLTNQSAIAGQQFLAFDLSDNVFAEQSPIILAGAFARAMPDMLQLYPDLRRVRMRFPDLTGSEAISVDVSPQNAPADCMKEGTN